MTDRGWKAAPTDFDCFGVLEWWSNGNNKSQITNIKQITMTKIQKGHREKE
jgi:hypothetical protein